MVLHQEKIFRFSRLFYAPAENTKPTYHNRILIADVGENNPENLKKIEELLQITNNEDDMALVAVMKEIVPEFISKNSKYQQLDK